MLQSLERISALSDNVVIGLNLGVCRRLEKMDPGQTVNNLIEIHRQFQEKVQLNEACVGCSWTDFDIQGLACFLMSPPPVLVSEARLCPYSETWSAALASQLASQCSQHQVTG